MDAVQQAATQHGENGIVLWFALVRQRHQIPDDQLTMGVDLVPPVRSVRDLRIYFDTDARRTDCVQLLCGSACEKSEMLKVSICSINKSVSACLNSSTRVRYDQCCKTQFSKLVYATADLVDQARPLACIVLSRGLETGCTHFSLHLLVLKWTSHGSNICRSTSWSTSCSPALLRNAEQR